MGYDTTNSLSSMGLSYVLNLTEELDTYPRAEQILLHKLYGLLFLAC